MINMHAVQLHDPSCLIVITLEPNSAFGCAKIVFMKNEDNRRG